MKSKKSLVTKITLLTLSVLIIAVVSGCSKLNGSASANETNKEIVTAVQIVEPRFEEISNKISFSGVTVPHKVTNASFMVPGKIVKMNFETGDKVKKGQLLATLDPEMFRRQVGVASAAVNTARAHSVKVDSGARPQEIDMARRQMLQAKSSFDLANKEKQRFDRLYKIDAIPKRDHDQVVARYEISKEQYKAALQQYDLVREGASREDKSIARANVQLNQAQLAQASTQLAYTRLYSPISGVITEKREEVGTVVNAGMPVYKIQSVDSIYLEIFVPSVHVDLLRIGRKADVTFLESSGKVSRGVVTEIKPASDDKTRAYKVKLKLTSNPNLKSYTGTIGKATFVLSRNGEGAFVPLACIVSSPDDDTNFVFVVDENNRARKVEVKVVTIKDQKAMIKGDLSKTCKLVLSGQEYLRDKGLVSIVSGLDSQRYVTPDRVEKDKYNGSRL